MWADDTYRWWIGATKDLGKSVGELRSQDTPVVPDACVAALEIRVGTKWLKAEDAEARMLYSHRVYTPGTRPAHTPGTHVRRHPCPAHTHGGARGVDFLHAHGRLPRTHAAFSCTRVSAYLDGRCAS